MLQRLRLPRAGASLPLPTAWDSFWRNDCLLSLETNDNGYDDLGWLK